MNFIFGFAAGFVAGAAAIVLALYAYALNLFR